MSCHDFAFLWLFFGLFRWASRISVKQETGVPASRRMSKRERNQLPQPRLYSRVHPFGSDLFTLTTQLLSASKICGLHNEFGPFKCFIKMFLFKLSVIMMLLKKGMFPVLCWVIHIRRSAGSCGGIFLFSLFYIKSWLRCIFTYSHIICEMWTEGSVENKWPFFLFMEDVCRNCFYTSVKNRFVNK